MKRAIYEAVNNTLKELFIGTTGVAVDEVGVAHRTNPPRAIRHWLFSEHRVGYREIEHDLQEKDVRPFIEVYARSIQRGGWRIIIE